MFAFLGWIFFGIIVGAVAKSVGRGFWSYFFLSIFLSPLIGFVVLLIKGKITPEEKLRTFRKNRHIFYCKACNDAYGGVGKNIECCPSCNNILMETSVLVEDWRKYSEEKKSSLKKAFSEGQFSINAPTP